jgi:hypothetical protein
MGRAILPTTIVVAVANVALGGAGMRLVIVEAIAVWHAWYVSNYWRNRAEGNPAEYVSVRVSDDWDGDPEQADLGMLIVSTIAVLLPFCWMLA